MIRVSELAKDFGGRVAVDHVSFTVSKGEVLGFLGPNGAGKTTTMRMITGFLPPSAGEAEVDGYAVTQKPVEVRKRIGYMPENAPLYGDMTVEALLRFVAEIRGFVGNERDLRTDATLDKCFLRSVRRQSIETLSKGYRQRTCFAQALLHDPPILILDEPTDGLDPNQKKVVRDMIQQMASEKVIILSTHILEEVEAICSRAIIISHGKIVADSTPAELKKQADSYNALTVRMVADADAAREAFAALGDVEQVQVLEQNGDQAVLKLNPKKGQSIAPQVLEEARGRNWLITDIHTESGRLDEVFQRLTETDDVAGEKKR